ncbi:MAG: ATP-binding cassette domain-containing protein [Ruminiclostridium sp.]|nr:ATP-binding cassette domain-containing protein [Ruminiclostridium sp.]
MLSLKNIKKNYKMGETVVEALRGVSVDFRENEFVAVLGQSGCGKTTLLNIIGGLDRYTEGDLIISGVSTKKYRDRDWDTYRNHRIGFVFQSYNLIPHQTVLSNVELALTLSGVSRAERRKRAVEVLEKVGLKDQMKKKPNQMSGGQMQRVAIARALINDPDILLADEPTGALDSETSVQIMEILKEIAKDKLIIMVTHNPELAEQYANRIIRLVDGKIISDSKPYEDETPLKDKPEKVRRTSMSFFTALSLSLNNLMTKKGRTILTAFAGSIGIIGIALILSLSSGVQKYIDDIQHDTLASYPLTIEESTTDITSFFNVSRNTAQEKLDEQRPLDRIYTSDRMGYVFESMYDQTNTNDLRTFKKFLDGSEDIQKNITNIEYSYGMTLQIFRELEDGTIKQVNPNTVLDDVGFGSVAGIFSLSSQVSSSAQGVDVFRELTDNKDMFDTKFELLAGTVPQAYNEAVLIIDPFNDITDFTAYALGLQSTDDIRSAIRDMMQKKDKNEIKKLEKSRSYEYDDFIGMTFSVIPNPELYKRNDDGVWDLMTGDADFMEKAYKNGVELKIVGIVREKEMSSNVSGTIGYTRALTERVSSLINDSAVVKEQQENADYDVFTGLPFEGTEAGDKAIAEAKAEEERKQKELEEMQQKIKEATEKYKALQETMAGALQGLQGLMPGQGEAGDTVDMQSIMASLTPEQQAELAEMTPEQQQEYLAQLAGAETGGDMTAGMPDMSSIIAMLPEEQQEQLAGMTPAEQAAFLSELSGEETGGDTGTPDMSEAAAGFDLSGFDFSSFDMSGVSGSQMEYFMSMSDEQRAELMKQFSGAAQKSEVVSSSSQFDNLRTLGVISMDTPSSIAIYPKDFEAKENIVKIIADYNATKDEDNKITYTDIVGMLMSSVTDIINAISYILIAFVAISLVVSSIMIGIITYISVLERTKEIGILRSIGASKKDISRVFNAETVIVGFVAGALGILVTALMIIPINIIIDEITKVKDLAFLPPVAAVILIAISIVLTMIAGLLPSKVAAKKDPVVALRTE